MKRIISTILTLTMIATLFTGCSSEPSDTVQTTADETVAETDVGDGEQQEEMEQAEAELIRAALNQGWIPEDITGDLSKTITWIPESVSEDLRLNITWKEMTTMLAAMIYQCNPDLLPDWVKLASNALEMDSPMECLPFTKRPVFLGLDMKDVEIGIRQIVIMRIKAYGKPVLVLNLTDFRISTIFVHLNPIPDGLRNGTIGRG